MLDFIRREPAAIVGVIVAVVALVIAFGIPISADQKAAIVGVVTAVLSLLGAGVTRSQVTPLPARKRNEAGQVALTELCIVATAVLLLLILLLGVGVLR